MLRSTAEGIPRRPLNSRFQFEPRNCRWPPDRPEPQRYCRQSPACRFRIEDHSLLAGLYFAVLEGAGPLVDAQDDARRGQFNGVFKGWWSEVPSREAPDDAGAVEFTLSRRDGALSLDGRWKCGNDAAEEWYDDWDLG